MGLQQLLDDLLGRDLPVAVECYDGSRVGPTDAPATVRIVSPDAIHRIVTGRGRELAFARAYVAGEIDIDGDIFAVIALRDRVAKPTVSLSMLRNAAAQIGITNLRTLTRLRPPERQFAEWTLGQEAAGSASPIGRVKPPWNRYSGTRSPGPTLPGSSTASTTPSSVVPTTHQDRVARACSGVSTTTSA